MKKYEDIYNEYKEYILSGQLKSGDKMPSIRKATALHGVSKTTVMNAYFELQADGYIIASEKSGFFVTDIVAHQETVPAESSEEAPILYDLKSGNADSESFDLSLWQRYIKSALRQEERLLSYADVQGEYDLRDAICTYIREKRNVTASPDRIVIGAGVQSLLNVLCPLLKGRKTVSFPDGSFTQGMALFESYGYEVHTRNKDAQIIYVSPSHMTSYGDVMPTKRRMELVRYSEQHGSVIIEDDYDSEFLYQIKPSPALYALSGGGNVVYMGSFSNILLPAIRISFMVLTKELAAVYQAQKQNFAQTASKTEQIALCGYIRDRHIHTQTRKTRRLYTTKAKALLSQIQKEMPSVNAKLSENGLQVKLSAAAAVCEEDFDAASVSVYIKENNNGNIHLVLSPSAIPQNEIENAVFALKKALKL